MRPNHLDTSMDLSKFDCSEFESRRRPCRRPQQPSDYSDTSPHPAKLTTQDLASSSYSPVYSELSPNRRTLRNTIRQEPVFELSPNRPKFGSQSRGNHAISDPFGSYVPDTFFSFGHGPSKSPSIFRQSSSQSSTSYEEDPQPITPPPRPCDLDSSSKMITPPTRKNYHAEGGHTPVGHFPWSPCNSSRQR